MSTSQAEQRERLSRLRGFLRSDPKNRKLLQEAAEVALRCAEFAQAREILDAALAAYRDDAEFRFQLGTVMLAEGTYGEAATLFAALHDGGMKHPAIRYNLAYAHLSAGQFGPAHALLAKFTDADWQEVPGAHKLYAHACHHLEDPASGIPHLEKLLERNDQDAEAWGLLAMLQYDSDRLDQLKSSAERALKIDTDEPNARLALGSWHLEQGEPDVALSHLEKLVKLHPETGRAWSALGFSHFARVDLPAATSAFGKATQYSAEDPMAWYGQGWVQVLNADLAAARRSFEQALKLDPKFDEAKAGLAAVDALSAQAGNSEAMRDGIAQQRDQIRARVAQVLTKTRRK